MDIVPATTELSGAEVELQNMMAREQRLAVAVRDVEEDYDFIIIDCPPALGLLTINAFTASHTILIPVQAEFFALEGLAQIWNTMRQVQKHFNPHLDIEGIVVTMFDVRNNLSKDVYEEVVSNFGEKVYKVVIPRNVPLAEAPSYGKTIIDYDPRARGAEAYMELAKEVLANG